MKRKHPNMSEKLASALLEVQRLRGDPIPREHAKAMSAQMICSLYQFDHDAGYACHGTDNHPTKLTPLLRPEHREKTAKIDQPAIAKCARLTPEHEDFQKRVLAKKTGQGDPEYLEVMKATARQSGRWPSRPLNTKGAKLQSRNNLRRKEVAK